MKKWIIRESDKETSAALAKKCGLSDLCADILNARGINTEEKAAAFFNYKKDENESPFSDPFLIKDMKEASDIILEAADNGDSICIYGDYDCDGVTASVILYTYLESRGADVRCHINMREQGFGLCESVIRKLAEDGVKLIVTVDNGVSAVNETALANELGMTVVITDHHRTGEVLPAAAAVVDPHRDGCPSPYKDLCGCGVALKLIAAMDGGNYSAAVEQFSDFAAIATIADSVPLTGENRDIVNIGLHYLENTENPGLRTLMEHAGISGKSGIKADDDVAFRLAPLINAAGRMGSASDAAELFLEDDPDKADVCVKKLEKYNKERKSEEAAIMTDIERLVTENPSVLYKRVLVVYGESWHHGAAGIIAARLVERFGKPAFVLFGADEVRGSARSVEGFPVHEALNACGNILTKQGGHPGAGGFSLPKENISAFENAIQKYAAETFAHMPVYTLYADKCLTAEELTAENIKSLSLLEPFGEGNPPPVFLMRGAAIAEISPLGAGGAHTKLTLNWENRRCYAYMFRLEAAKFPYRIGDVLDILATIKTEVYEGKEYIKIFVKDCRIYGISQPRRLNAAEAYENFRRDGKIDPALAERIIPERKDLEIIYKLMAASGKIYCDVLSARLDAYKIPYCKMMLALDIFEELGFISVNRFEDYAEIIHNAPKASIESSEIYRALHNAAKIGDNN